MIFITVPIAIVAGLIIAKYYKPKSKSEKIWASILIPLISGVLIHLLVASCRNSGYGFAFDLGATMVFVAIPAVALLITMFIAIKAGKEDKTEIKDTNETFEVPLHYGTGDNRVDFELQLTKEEIVKLGEMRREDPSRWKDNDLELVKAAKKELFKREAVQEEVAQVTLKASEVPSEADKSDQREAQFIDKAVPETKAEVKPTQDDEEPKDEQSTTETQTDVKLMPKKKEEKDNGNTLSKWLKVLLIVILSLGAMFGISVLASIIYTNYVYPSKAKSDDERLIQEAKANPSKAYKIARVLFKRDESGHQSEYHDFISGKQGICDLDHTKVGMEVANIYCQYCIDSAKRDIVHSAHVARDMLFYKTGGYCDELFIKTGVELIKFGAEEGDSIAQFALGCYYSGYKFNQNGEWDDYRTIDGKNVDEAKAAYWYLQSANQGFTTAMGNLGNAYINGSGVGKDEKKGLEWIQKAANLGDAFFQRVLGDYYMDGLVIEVGSHKVVTGYYWDWDYDDYGNFGKHRHANTKTVTDYKTILAPDIKQAQYWWKKAAGNGAETAKERLQQIYE